MKKYVIFALLAMLMLVGASCGNKDTKKNTQNQGTQTSQNRQSFWDNDNFVNASSTDLKVGTKIFVMGEKNSDGSTTADGILIGANQDSLRNIMRTKTSSTPPQGTTGAGNKRPDTSQFQNMSEKERQGFMEQRMKERGITAPEGGFRKMNGTGQKTGARMAGAGGKSTINGEILNIDDSTITVKLADGGSKIILYSKDVLIKKIKTTVSL